MLHIPINCVDSIIDCATEVWIKSGEKLPTNTFGNNDTPTYHREMERRKDNYSQQQVLKLFKRGNMNAIVCKSFNYKITKPN